MRKLLILLVLCPVLAYAQIKVNALPAVGSVGATDLTIDDQSGVTSTATMAQLATFFSTNLGDIGLSGTLTKSGTSLLNPQFGTLFQQTLGGAPGATTNNANSFANYWKITDNMDDTGVGSNLGVAGALQLDYLMTSTTKAGRTPLVVRLDSNANTADSGVTDRNYVGITSFVNTHSEGGTANTAGNTFGQWYGLNTNVVIPITATFNTVATTQENDIANLSTTLDNKIGISVVTTSQDAQQGIHGDAAITIAGQAALASGLPGWKCGICFGFYNGFPPIAATGIMIGDWANNTATPSSGGSATVGYGIKWDNYTFTNFSLDLPNFTVAGTGATTINGTTLIQAAFTQNSGNAIIGDTTHSVIVQGNSSSTLKQNNQLLLSGAVPTISSGFGTGASVTASSGAGSFSVNVGTGGAASSGVVAMAATASHGWACSAADVTTPATNMTQQSASSTTTATFVNYVRTTGVAGAWPASDILEISCLAN